MARLTPRTARFTLIHPRSGAAALAIVVAAGLFAACGNSGLDLARQACTHINRSVALLHQADRTGDATTATDLRHRAYVQLLDALPISAEAAYDDAEWQALMTTLSQSNTVSETTLLPALRSECNVANSSVFNQAPAPSSIPSATIPPPSVPSTSH